MNVAKSTALIEDSFLNNFFRILPILRYQSRASFEQEILKKKILNMCYRHYAIQTDFH